MTHVDVEQRDPASPASNPATARTPAFSVTRADILATSFAFAAYLVLAVLANWNAWSMGATKVLQGSQDPKLNTWLLAWTPFAVSHGVNPMFSHWVNVPYGVNYSANVAIPLLGIIVSPITAVWGPVAAINVIISLAFFSSAVAGYCFVRHWVRWRPAAFLGGLVFGFSPYVVAEGNAHIHTMFVCFIPFIFLVLDEMFVRQRYSQRVLGPVLGLLLIAQYFVASELLATTAVMVVIAAVLVALFNMHAVRAHVMAALPGVALALGLAVVILAVPIYYSLRGPLHYNLLIPPGQYQSDLLSALLPTSNQLIAPTSAAVISNQFANNLSENGAYLGLPFLILILGVGVAGWRSKVLRTGVLLIIAAYVLSLGSPLRVDNKVFPKLHLPGGILRHLPLFGGVVFARFSLFVFLFGALVLGITIERLRDWSRWPRRWMGLPVAAVVSALVLVPLIPTLPYAELVVDTPSFFTTTAVDAVPQSSVAVVYPPTTPVDADSTLWQASANMRFKMPGVYALVPVAGPVSPNWGSPTVTSTTLQSLQAGAAVPRTRDIRTALRLEWRNWNAQSVIVGPGGDEANARDFLTWVIGKPPVFTHGVYLWTDLQQSIKG
jgi:hypothetical protein